MSKVSKYCQYYIIYKNSILKYRCLTVLISKMNGVEITAGLQFKFSSIALFKEPALCHLYTVD